jgi:hypothetical protein
MSNNSTSYIYKLTSDKTDKIFIGSTSQNLDERLAQHKRDYKRYLEHKYHYVASFEFVTHKNCKIEVLHSIKSSDKSKIRKWKQIYINLNPHCVNKHNACRCKDRVYSQRYYKRNYEKILQRKVEYRKNNWSEISKRRSQKIECECGLFISKSNFAKHKRTAKHIKSIAMQN